ncbi:ArsR/SmtB family transcription factor [Rhodococcus qingshengii]|uniref:ArsR/SmtB family transcription factor n=1 Tax=Rhodococcus qingshengii TaxID=334542 RepID=UPI001BE661A7|nr:winged helix-turn-helix domain-containing protein [Rhodococcus qingshengii]MBT2274813.1 winged helix-turn-helix transcriptional regulator [Rhodococcus qingshengii]
MTTPGNLSKATFSKYGDADVASVAALIADPARGRILMALADGRALPASVLATEAGISAQSASGHLKKLVAGNLLRVAATGRHRYYTLAGAEIAAALESLALIAAPYEITSLRQGTRANALRQGRTCYDHIAGKLGVSITEGLLELDALVRVDGETDARRRDSDPLAAGAGENCPYELGPEAIDVFAGIGVDLETIHNGRSRRPLLRACVDWTEQRHHIAGTLGAEICRAWIEAGWIVRRQRERAITLTTRGERALEVRLGRTL